MEEKLKETYGKNPGWKVPDGYFDSFYIEMSEKLPEMKLPASAEPLSKWQRVKPYLYLAAMFAGIWMMMKVFHTASQNASLNLENPPEHIAMLMASDPDYDLYADPDIDSDDIDSVLNSYDSMEDLGKDMGIEIQPAYDKGDF